MTNDDDTSRSNYCWPKSNTSDAAERETKEHELISQLKIKATNYVSNNHFAVLTQMAGSVWPNVLPYCIANTLLTYLVYYLSHHHDIVLTFSDKGHSFMSMLVSFLIVTRSNIAYNRLMEANSQVVNCMRNCRELVQHTVAFTRHDTGVPAIKWRSQVARRTIVLLHTTVAVLEYESKGVEAWKTAELSRDEKKALLASVGKSNERSPIVLALFLRSTIAAHGAALQTDFHVNKELYLLNFVSNFSSAYHGLVQLITTPFPFPLVQMARTFLFFWVFTLPFALVGQYTNIPALLLINFVLTYGFVGLEYVSINMDDPFGDDPTDFDVIGLAQVVCEDIYLAIYDTDGKEAANNLKKSIEGDTSCDDNGEPFVKKKRHVRVPSIDAWNNSKPEKKCVSVVKGKLLRGHSDGMDMEDISPSYTKQMDYQNFFGVQGDHGSPKDLPHLPRPPNSRKTRRATTGEITPLLR